MKSQEKVCLCDHVLHNNYPKAVHLADCPELVYSLFYMLYIHVYV